MTQKNVFTGQYGLIGSVLIASVFVNLLVLTAPIYMLQLFTRVMSSGSISTLIALTAGAAVALVFYFLFDMIRQRLVARLGTRLEARLGPVILNGVLKGAAPVDESLPLRDLQEIRGFVTSPVFIALLDAPWSVLFVAVIALFHPLLGVIAAFGIAVLFALGVISEIAGRKPNAEAQKAANRANETVAEMTRNGDIVRAMGGVPVMIMRWTAHSFASMVHGTLTADRVALMTSLAKLARVALQIAVLCAGVVLVLAGDLTPGAMIAASILLGRAAAPVEQSIAGWRALLQARQARDRLNILLGRIGAGDDRLELPAPEGHLAVEEATVVLPDRQEPLLFGVGFELSPGQSLGIIGPSGAGKTTLARVLAGLQPLARGYVRIDSAALTDWPADQIGRYVGFLPQRVELFAGSVAENIAMMDPEAKPSDIVAAAKLAEVHELILALPGGYNAQVGERGERLSAGQRQRIALARSFFGDRRLIVLDEPNANLDPDGEEALSRAVENATARGAVVVVVTHRMNILRRVSHAAVMKDGRLVRFGVAREVFEAFVAATSGSERENQVASLAASRGADQARLAGGAA